ncbi:MAG: restriction endonuclease [Candidatus Dormibacteria bacterium]
MKPRRNRSDGFAGLVDIFAELPWWAVPIAVGAIYLVVGWVLPAMFPARTLTDRVSLGRALLTPWFASLLAGLVALVGVLGQIKRFRRRRLYTTKQDRDSVLELTWSDFEAWVAEAYRRQGYSVTETSRGADGGVDMVLEREGATTYVQCKHWRASKVNVRPIRELYGVMAGGSADRGVMVTTGRFTAAAVAEARGKPLDLIGGDDLLRLLGSRPSGIAECREPDSRAVDSPRCPRCGRGMVVREARRGANPGSLFWGCPGFPKCRGAREMER